MAMEPELIKHLFKKRATVLYPFEKLEVPPGLRGVQRFFREKCIGCGICARICPAKAIEMVEDEKGKRPIFYLDRCIFCAECEEKCPKKAIKLSEEYEVAGYTREQLIHR